MAVAVDNTGQSQGGTSTTTLTIASYVVGAGSNRCIYLGVSQWKAADLQPTAVFNTSENFTAHDSQTVVEGAGVRRVTLFRLVNPTVTTASIVVTWGVAVDEGVAGASSWNGVDQTTPFGTAVKNSGNAASSSINLTGAVGDVNHCAISADSAAAAGITANQTQRWRAIAAATTTEGAGQSSSGTGATVAHTWSTISAGEASHIFAHIGVAIQQATATASYAPLLGSLFVGPRLGGGMLKAAHPKNYTAPTLTISSLVAAVFRRFFDDGGRGGNRGSGQN